MLIETLSWVIFGLVFYAGVITYTAILVAHDRNDYDKKLSKERARLDKAIEWINTRSRDGLIDRELLDEWKENE